MNKFFHPNFVPTKIDIKANEVQIIAEPLVQGFGTTLGNSMRRVLLSSLLGTALFCYQIKGVEQEFQTLSGARENVLQIGLNLQKIVFKTKSGFEDEGKIFALKIKVSGPKIVTAGDIELPEGIKVVNASEVIVNLVDKVDFEINMWAYTARGFTNFMESKNILKQIKTHEKKGFIALGANFSPVIKVSVQVEETHVGEQLILEKLILGIKTNGAKSPTDCLSEAASIFDAHLQFFKSFNNKTMKDFEFQIIAQEEEGRAAAVPLSEMNFSKRTFNGLWNYGIRYLEDLKKLPFSELSNVKNLGSKSLSEIEDKLKNEYNFKFSE